MKPRCAFCNDTGILFARLKKDPRYDNFVFKCFCARGQDLHAVIEKDGDRKKVPYAYPQFTRELAEIYEPHKHGS